MTAREAGAHAFTRERQNFPPSGEMAPPFGLAPHGSGSAPLRGTFGSTCFAPQKTKASLTTFAHTKAFVMSVCSHALAQKTKTTKDKALHKGVIYGVTHPCTAPFGASAIGANAAQGTQTTSALHKGVFYDRTCSLRSHKSVRSASSALALAQRRVLWKYVLLMQSVCMALTSAITGRVYDIDERHTKACFMILKKLFIRL